MHWRQVISLDAARFEGEVRSLSNLKEVILRLLTLTASAVHGGLCERKTGECGAPSLQFRKKFSRLFEAVNMMITESRLWMRRDRLPLQGSGRLVSSELSPQRGEPVSPVIVDDRAQCGPCCRCAQGVAAAESRTSDTDYLILTLDLKRAASPTETGLRLFPKLDRYC